MKKAIFVSLATLLISCTHLSPAKGAVRVEEKDGMEMVFVAAGKFTMGNSANNPAADEDESPEHVVYLESFWIDKTEVTNAMFVGCIDSGECKPPAQTMFYLLEEYAEHPVFGVSWDQANAYCGWAGRRLPTEAEWEKAARGIDSRIFPWGNESPTIEFANFRHAVNETMPVGSYPKGASFYGALDMGGNVWEWVADAYAPDFYSRSPTDNPVNSSPVNQRVLRGGNWDSNAEGIRSTNRFWAFPGRNDTDGFRCADSD